MSFFSNVYDNIKENPYATAIMPLTALSGDFGDFIEDKIGKPVIEALGQATGLSSPEDFGKTEFGPIQDLPYEPFQPSQDYTDLISQIKGDINNPVSQSLAQEILRNQANRDVKASAALLGSQRGVTNPALLAREIANIRAERGATLGGQAAEAQLREDQYNTQNRMSLQQNLAQMLESNRQSQIERERLQNAQNIAEATGAYNTEEAQKNRQSSAQQAQANRFSNTLGNVGMGLATYAASDKKLKKNISDGSKMAQSFLDSLRAIEFDYKDPQFDGEGRWGGVLAQDVEKGPGKVMVGEDERGKNLDFVKGLSLMMAGMGNLNDRVKKLEA